MRGDTTAKPLAPGSKWETLVWPPWLPVRARVPLIAQIAGAVALLAAVTMPQWSEVATAPEAPSVGAAPRSADPAPPPPARPAHLNLDVRHAFGGADLSVTVDGERMLATTIAGGARRFGVFGKRPERGFTKTLELSPGVRIVRVRVRSPADNFDQSRVERFDLDSASVAAMRITAGESGLTVAVERPPAAQAPVSAHAPPGQPAPHVIHVTPATQAHQAGAAAEVYQSLRATLIAIAGFIASAATGFVVQEFLRSRKGMIFTVNAAGAAPATAAGPRRRRVRKTRRPSGPDTHADLG